jgi:adenylate cyclase
MSEDPPQAVMFADLAGFTALTEAHGDHHAVDAAQRFLALAQGCLSDDARVVKTIGDAVMIVSIDVTLGLDIAMSLIRQIEHETQFPGVRVGMHVGPVVDVDGDVFGATVNVAARLTARAHVGQLVATSPFAELANGSDHLTVIAMGPTHLKHVAEPIELFAIEHVDRHGVSQVLDPVCRMYVDAEDAPGRLPWSGRNWSFCSLECASTFAVEPARYADLPTDPG